MRKNLPPSPAGTALADKKTKPTSFSSQKIEAILFKVMNFMPYWIFVIWKL